MRLLTYNIHKGIGGRDRLYRLERVIETIEQENPDLICLQEVDRNVARSKFDDQPRLLARHFNAAAHIYQQNVHVREGGYGNLLLSRWPLAGHHQISLRLHNRKPRGAQLAEVQTPEGSMLVVNWHLGLAERERHWQVHHLLGHHLFLEFKELPALDRRRLQRLAQYAGGGSVRAARLRADCHAAFAVSFLSGLSGNWLARQSFRSRPSRHSPGPDCPLGAVARGLGPSAAGD